MKSALKRASNARTDRHPRIQPKYEVDMGLLGHARTRPSNKPGPPQPPRMSHKNPHRSRRSEILAHSLSSLAPSFSLPSPISIESGAMSSSDSRSDDEVDAEYKLALRIALERFKVNTGGSSPIPLGATPLPPVFQWVSSNRITSLGIKICVFFC
jgi:hypothetical protein